MSYCRWSSDNFKSDVYAFESGVDEYTILVASHRIVGDLLPIDFSRYEGDIESYKTRMDSVNRVRIGLPHDGDMFTEPDLVSFRARLEALRDMGYHVPSHVFARIDAEILEMEARS